MLSLSPHRSRRPPRADPVDSGLLTLVLVLSLAALAGCGVASGGDHGEGDVPTIVPQTEEIFRIGSLSGGRWESFSRIVSAGFDAKGNLYLLDGNESRVTVVDPDGRFVRTVGKAGDGPGEFRRPMAMAVFPDGRVVVSDGGHRGFLLFDAAGEFQRSIPFGEGVSAPSILLRDGDDALVYPARTTMVMMGGPGGRGPGGPAGGPGRTAPGTADVPSDVPVHRLEIDGDGEPEVLHRAWTPPRVEPEVSSGGGMMRMIRPTRAFEPEMHVAVLPGGRVAIVDSTTYRIQLVEPGRGSASPVERPVAPVSVTDREREREKARRLQELEEGGGGTGQITVMGAGGAPAAPDPAQVRAMREAQLESMVFWPEIQVIQELRADREGRLWVRRFGDVGEPGPIEILGRDGALRAIVPAGAMEMPAAFGPDGVAAWIEHDDLDVPYVRVARLGEIPSP